MNIHRDGSRDTSRLHGEGAAQWLSARFQGRQWVETNRATVPLPTVNDTMEAVGNKHPSPQGAIAEGCRWHQGVPATASRDPTTGLGPCLVVPVPHPRPTPNRAGTQPTRETQCGTDPIPPVGRRIVAHVHRHTKVLLSTVGGEREQVVEHGPSEIDVAGVLHPGGMDGGSHLQQGIIQCCMNVHPDLE